MNFFLMKRHTVTFKLKHPANSPGETAFLQKAKTLAKLPTVRNFECLTQISKKNNYDFGLSMEFANQSAYEAYNEHPDHVPFIQDIWIPEVTDFIEIDYAV